MTLSVGSVSVILLDKDKVFYPGFNYRMEVTSGSNLQVTKDLLKQFDQKELILVACFPQESDLLSSVNISEKSLSSHLADKNKQENKNKKTSNDKEKDNLNKLTQSFKQSQTFIDNIPLHKFGVLACVTSIYKTLNSKYIIDLEGFSRIQLSKIVSKTPFVIANVSQRKDIVPDSFPQFIENFDKLKAISINFTKLLQGRISRLAEIKLREAVKSSTLISSGILCDFLATTVKLSYPHKLAILDALYLPDRIDLTIQALKQKFKNLDELQSLTPLDKVTSLKSRSSPIHNLKGSTVKNHPAKKNESEFDILSRKIKEAHLPNDANNIAQAELTKLKSMHPTQAEYHVCLNYLNILADIPWSKSTNITYNKNTVQNVKDVLDKDHYGLTNVKKRLLEYVSVLRLKNHLKSIDESEQKLSETTSPTSSIISKALQTDNNQITKQIIPTNNYKSKLKPSTNRSPILLLVGPPGVGKTSLATSVAFALGLKFQRLSLGGVRDESDIRGHRRTYVGAMPGLIVQGLLKVKTNNPVFLLDEVDKLGRNSLHGDPSAALLEVLDPEQNHTFADRYVNTPIDISKVLFIATANSLDTIPPPLLDRMEVIFVPGYTYYEKCKIARNYLLPKQILAAGLANDDVIVSDEVLMEVITNFTHESGVRQLEREIAALCRAKATEYVERVIDSKDFHSNEEYIHTVSKQDLVKYLGVPKYENELHNAQASQGFGVVVGLSYMGSGMGGIMILESILMPGKGELKLTGNLGKVIRESALICLSWVKSNAYTLGLVNSPQTDVLGLHDIHTNAPAAAIPKEGPSAGVAITISFISLFSKKPVPSDIAMTGEMTLRGKVLAVGGIKEKVLGAHRAGIKRIILPYANKKDVDNDVEKTILKEIEFSYASNIYDVINTIWPEFNAQVLNLSQL